MKRPAGHTWNLKGLGARERELISALAASEKPAVSADDVVQHLGVSRPQANLMLSRLSKKGWLQRLRRGVYAVVPIHSRTGEPVAEQPFAIATTLFAPCYISGWSSAEHWGLTEQISNTIVVYTARRQRTNTQLIGRVTYRTRYLPEGKIFGTRKIWSGAIGIQVADPHRTVVDILESPPLGGGGRQTLDIVKAYWNGEHVDADRLLEYALRIGSGALLKRLGFTAERFNSPSEQWIRRCREQITKGITRLDPSGPCRGKIVSRWNLRINIPMPEAE
jgi:predicted transcriptional regulator of viral defense system